MKKNIVFHGSYNKDCFHGEKKKWKLQVNFVFYKSMLAMSFIQVCFFLFDAQNTNMKDYIFILT